MKEKVIKGGNKDKNAEGRAPSPMTNALKGACIAFFLMLSFGGAAFCAGPATTGLKEAAGVQEQTARELRVELSRLGASGDPEEREALLRQIIDKCPDTEEAEAAHWALSDLYMDAFSEPREAQAREALERFLKQYPNSRWGTQVKMRLVHLYQGTGSRDRLAQLCSELLKGNDLPASMRSSLNALAAAARRKK